MSTEKERARLTERRDIISRDIEELAEQVSTGEIDESTAADLRAHYVQDLVEVEARLAEPPRTRRKRPTRRRLTSFNRGGHRRRC